MAGPPPLILDRCIAATDRALADEAALDDLLDVFAPDAEVQIADTPIRGAAALREFYSGFIADHAESQHYANTTVLPDGRQGRSGCALRGRPVGR